MAVSFRFGPLLPAACLLAACGHLVAGYSSIPYLESAPPVVDQSVRTGIPQAPLVLPGARISIKLWNDVFTSEPEAKAFNRNEAGDYVMLIQITPEAAGMSFEPLAARLVIDGTTYSAQSYSGSETDMRVDLPRGRKREFASWDGRSGHHDQGVPRSPVVLAQGCFYTVTLHFAAPKPSPDQDITFDLSSALSLAGGQVPERIRFRKTFWQEMHQ